MDTKPGKMTDDEVQRRAENAGAGQAWCPRDEYAHIAALTAELEALRGEEAGKSETLKEMHRLLDDAGVAPGSGPARVSALTANRDAAVRDLVNTRANRDAANRCRRKAEEACDALRERVQALEAEVLEACEGREAMLSHLGAMDRTLAAIRQRAGDGEGLNSAIIGVGGPRFDVARAAVQYALGPPVPASEMDGIEGEMAEAPTGNPPPEQADHELAAAGVDVPAFIERLRETVAAARIPTTAEDFATVRRGWQVMDALEVPAGHSGDEESGQHDEDCALCAHESLLSWSEDAAHALARIEARVGALEQAAARVVEEARRLGPLPGGLLADIADLSAALTDAPPVFALEEVRTAFMKTSPGLCPNYDWGVMAGHLSALQRGTP